MMDESGQDNAGKALDTGLAESLEQAQEKLRADEALLRQFIEHVPAAVAMFDKEMHYIMASRRWLTDYRLGERNIIGLSHYEVFPEAPQRWREIHQRCLAGSVERCEEDRFERQDGTVDWISWDVRPWYAADDAVGGIIMFTEVITERKRVELALREHEELNRRIIETSLDRISVLDLEGRLISMSPASLKMLEIEDIGPLLGTPWIDLWPDEERQRASAALVQARAGGTGKFQAIGPTHSGKRIWWDVIVNAIPDATGRPERLLAISRDITERKQAEEELRQSEERFRLLANLAPVGVYQTDAQGNCRYVNERWCEMAGLRPEEALGDGWVQGLHPEDRAKVLAAWTQMVESQGRWGLEYRFLTAEGITTWVLGFAKPFYDTTGKLLGYLGANQDITTIKNAENEILELNQSLQRKVEELETLFVTVPTGIAIAEDPQCRVIRANPTFAEILEISTSDNASLSAPPGERPEHFRIIQGEREMPPEAQPMQTAAATGKPATKVELDVVHDHGRIVKLLGNAAPLFDEQGRPRGSIGAFADITNLKNAEAALRQSEQRLSMATQAAKVGIWNWDLLKGELTWTARSCELLGLPLDAEQSYPVFLNSVHPEDRQRVDDSLHQTITENREYNIEYRTVWRDGSIHWLNAIGNVTHDADGHPVGLHGVASDITERKKAEAALSEANAQLAEADRRKDEFLAMLAHELRNPLAPIRNAVQILRTVGSDRLILQRQHEVIDRQVGHMARLLDDLLDVSRFTRGKVELKRQPLSLLGVLTQAIETASPLIETRLHTLHFAPPPSDLRVEGDFDRLVQIVGNLLSNAAKYTDPGGEIWLSAARADDQAVIRVQDNGIGIAPELLPHIFELFTQANQSLDRAKGGLGIGLTLVQQLVQLHGGTIEAHSEGLGKGSEFIIRFPALPAEHAGEVAAEEPPEPQEEFTRRRILVVDDVIDTARSLAELLELWGHQVSVAYDGSSTLAEVRFFHPDIVLLDIGLPGMDGYEVVRLLRSEHGSLLKIVALTGYGQDYDRQKARESGFDEHMVKPVDLDALKQILRAGAAR